VGYVAPGQTGVSQLRARTARLTGWKSFPRIGQTGPIELLREEVGTMSDQGLSIFDEPDEGPTRAAGDDEQPTTVMGAPASETQPGQPAPRAAAATARPQVPASAGAQPTRQIPGFATVRRGGYDRDAVDDYLRQVLQEKSGVASALARSEQQVAELQRQLQAAQDELAENASPTYAGLGGRASAMLRLAEEEAGEIREGSRREAAEILEQANLDAASIRAEASREADDMRIVQLKELDETRARATADAEQERALAAAEAEDLRASAKRESDQIRLAAQQESKETKVGATREAEQLRAAADRDVQEARRTLAVERERLAKEATDHHASATAETKRLVEEAEHRAEAAEVRAREATAQATTHRQQAQREAEALLARARREAEQIVASARTQADAITSAGNAEAERNLAALTAEVDRMTKRREAISAQLGSLSEMMAGFGDDESA
jgi:cell division septum initiation protein DivIVA